MPLAAATPPKLRHANRRGFMYGVQVSTVGMGARNVSIRAPDL